MSAASITADQRIAFVCGQASPLSASKHHKVVHFPTTGLSARERRIRNAQSPNSLNQSLRVIEGQPQAQSRECLGKYLGVCHVSKRSKSGSLHIMTKRVGGLVGSRLKALLHQCVCELLAGAAMRVLLLVAIPALLPRSQPLLTHAALPRAACQPPGQTVQITAGSVFPIFQIYDC